MDRLLSVAALCILALVLLPLVFLYVLGLTVFGIAGAALNLWEIAKMEEFKAQHKSRIGPDGQVC